MKSENNDAGIERNKKFINVKVTAETIVFNFHDLHLRNAQTHHRQIVHSGSDNLSHPSSELTI